LPASADHALAVCLAPDHRGMTCCGEAQCSRLLPFERGGVGFACDPRLSNGCSDRPCLTGYEQSGSLARMLRPSVLLLGCLSLSTLVACAGDGDGLPALCKGDTPPKSLPLFSPCFGAQGGPDDLCAEGTCNDGYCAEPCVMDDDCLAWDGFEGYCSSSGVDLSEAYCLYLCRPDPDSSASADAACPMVDGIQLLCGHLFCEAPNPCEVDGG
jgi:hypothetical protein